MQSLATSLLSKYTNELLLNGTFVFAAPLFVLWPLSYLDNTWALARNKAEVLGEVIAEQMIELESRRPISLVRLEAGS